jgi:DNA-binding response OmpR family regulator
VTIQNEIPFDPHWSVDSAPAKPLPVASRQGNGSIPVVIAEDDSVTRALLSAIATRAGFRTVVTQDGHEAMAALRAETGPCVALIDWTMPGMDGMEVCQRIRSGGKCVYVIMLTARQRKEDAVKSLDGGADDYLTKPFDREELLARIRVGLRILKTQSRLGQRLEELERAADDAEPIRLPNPL